MMLLVMLIIMPSCLSLCVKYGLIAVLHDEDGDNVGRGREEPLFTSGLCSKEVAIY